MATAEVGARRSERDSPGHGWVDARPFRAHLRHLMAVGSLDAAEVAVVVGLSTRSVQHLLHGRAGRVSRRISPRSARRLLVVRPDHVRGLRWCLAPTGAARVALARLRADGESAVAVASAVGFGPDDLTAVEQQSHCNRLLAVRLVGLARALPSTRDDQDLVAVASAA